jgi:hypothetical protein
MFYTFKILRFHRLQLCVCSDFYSRHFITEKIFLYRKSLQQKSTGINKNIEKNTELFEIFIYFSKKFLYTFYFCI